MTEGGKAAHSILFLNVYLHVTYSLHGAESFLRS